ncbi:pregnancy-specific glycoprotein 22-like isoform X2 [Peromyscus californicus insignis]|uniref:pregnancy-specific glycoprotein 22-like isoform X2 n=1 Tax=Peromyscus californicus insignis TaxID=564181 RepID=UPI0022A7A32B|nr:pregnancy-specific glycoprotein 22-like isoform X2 [Peromyscus californicus insignis]
MEKSSMISFKDCTPWKGLLFTASLLTCWYRPTTAQVIIESVPPHVVEGESNLFLVHNLPENLLAISWFKEGANMDHRIVTYTLKYNIALPGTAHSGRETVYPNGSLWIQNVTHKDTGFYILQTISRQVKIVSRTYIHLHVYTSLINCGGHPTSAQPTIESVPPSVTEGSSVLLVVHHLPENLRALFWYKGINVFKNHEVGRHIIAKNSSVPGPAHSGRETVYSNGSLVLHNVTWKDAGFYTLLTLTTNMTAEVAHVQLQLDTSLSACCNPLTSAQITIEPVPRIAHKGKSVLLLVHNLPEDLRTFSWYKSMYSTHIFQIAEYSRVMNSTTHGPAHSRRTTVYTNGSLLLQDVTEKDAGFYTLQTLNKVFQTDKTHVELHVNQPVVQPFIRVTSTNVTVQSSVVLACISTDTGISTQWIFNNQSLQLTDRMTLSPKKCRLSIDPVRMEDAGEYKCEVSNPVSSMTSLPVRLAVMNE